MNDSIIKKIIKKQISYGARRNSFDLEDGQEIEASDYKFDIEELTVLDSLTSRILIENRYIVPKNEVFKQKIEDTFKRIIIPNSNKNYLCVNENDICNKEFIYYKYPHGRIFYIIKNSNYITNFYSLPEILDYKELFPDLYKLEASMPSKIKDEKTGELIQLTKWQDVKDLDSRRKGNIDKLVHRNKYLFNDSRSSFRWLCLNDEIFLTSLVLTFGYVEDKELNKYVLEKQLGGEISDFGKAFWYQSCDGKLFFHNQMIDIIKQSPIEKQKEYLRAISSYVHFLVNDEKFPFSQKAEILGKLCYYAEKIGESIDMGFKYFYILGIEEGGKAYEEEFKKRNYYNISDFEEVWEYTRTGGIGLPM